MEKSNKPENKIKNEFLEVPFISFFLFTGGSFGEFTFFRYTILFFYYSFMCEILHIYCLCGIRRHAPGPDRRGDGSAP
jgi:hypothetical protein